jgi:FkbM family methyltransferase
MTRLSPEERVLPAVGARLDSHPRLAAWILRAIRALPGRRLRPLAFRHLSQPLVTRMRSRLVTPVSGGSRMRVDMRDVSGRMLATSGVWEPHVTALFFLLLGAGEVCVDIGANVGYFSLLASKVVGPRGRVYAVEPAPDTFETLVANLELNHADNVVPEAVAAGAVEREAVLYDPRPGSNIGAATLRLRPEPSTGGARPPTTVPVEPFDQLVPPEDRRRVRLVKIDVEGAEADVLEGLEPVYEEARPDVIVEVHADLDPAAPASVASFCERHELNAYRIVDGHSDDREWEATHPVLEPLTTPADVAAIPEPCFDLLLAPRERPPSDH